jgi:hypothetical protein
MGRGHKGENSGKRKQQNSSVLSFQGSLKLLPVTTIS